MLLLGKIAVGLTVGTLATAGVLCSDGLIDVNVVQDGPDSHHVHVIAPALLVPLAVRLLPVDGITEASRRVEPWLPTIQAAASSLSETGDFVLVEGTQRDENFRVEKSGDELVINVTERDEVVHVSVPLRAVSSTLNAVASRTEDSQN